LYRNCLIENKKKIPSLKIKVDSSITTTTTTTDHAATPLTSTTIAVKQSNINTYI
jgi:hypothetical protein